MTTPAAAPIPFVPRTKLRPPRLPDDLLGRAPLIEKLQRSQTLSLVIAPAGYGKTALVLDDYHHVRDPAIHQLICGLIEHPPCALQLVLTTRYDPPLPHLYTSSTPSRW